MHQTYKNYNYMQNTLLRASYNALDSTSWVLKAKSEVKSWFPECPQSFSGQINLKINVKGRQKVERGDCGLSGISN